MSGEEKTESATPRRRNKEREKGNIARSQDMNSALVLFGAVGLMISFGPKILDKLKDLLFFAFTNIAPSRIDGGDISGLINPYFDFLVQIIFPFMCFLFILVIFLIWTQVGNLFVVEKVKPKFDKVSPKNILNNAKEKLNPFNVKNMVEFVKSVVKMVVVFFAGYSVLLARKDDLFGLLGANINTGFEVLGSIIIQMTLTICCMLMIIGFIDKKYQTYQYEKSIKMSKQEIKDEWKNIEGDPKIKSKIKSAQMKFVQQKMMSNILTADVIVTNPTHFAVAIKYDKQKAPAPIVVAKGVDFLAFKIREIAENNHIPIVENRPLARALYKLVPVDGTIPAELYVAVAEVLAWVYNRGKSEVKN